MTVTEIPKTRSPKLTTGRFGSSEQRERVWTCFPELGITPDDILLPSYWTHVARNFVLRDGEAGEVHVIRVYAEDGSWFSELLVQYASAVEAKVVRLRHVDLAPVSVESAAKDFVTKFSTGTKWQVQRASDKVIVKSGLGSEDAALLWIAEHRKTLAA